ncbi:uncharacterized protein DUF1631 [Thiogranum longum]|uniref:Uncharacterized protein DUF1631 n=1 Tax=Thiogranum longum TaxID=1537524 RepID=A0A4R1HF33_9GAMM|nr:DUF1631 family protein [Thiogranum longum]TCK17969.1 uncharacterized protein DUF1631 [Thiogranum longum]
MAIAPQFTKLLDMCLDMEISHLRPLVDRMFENADVALLDFAEKAQNNMAQSVFFEAMNEVRKRRKAIEQGFYKELKRSYSEFPVSPGNEGLVNPDDGALSLVNPEDMELSVAIQNASQKLSSRIMDRIFALKQRLSIVNGGNAIDESQIPGGPAWLGAAFQHAVGELELENKVRVVFVALFEKYVLIKVDSLFDEYNKRLIEADILPNLRYEVRKQPGSVEIIQKEVEPGSETDQPDNTDMTADTEPEQSPSELGDELFGRICELMAVRRTAPAGQAGGGGIGGDAAMAADNVTPIHSHATAGYAGSAPVSGGGYGGGAAPGTAGAPVEGGNMGGEPGGGGHSPLLPRIKQVQARMSSASATVSSDEFIENIEIDQTLIDRLQTTLTEERDKVYGDMDRRKLPAADTNVIELVGLLFEYMLKEDSLPNIVKALLSRLHTPLLKAAVIDKSFFTRSQHPARKLLNDMTAAGISWVDEGNIERGIFPKMKEIVDQVLNEFDEDVDIFEGLVTDFGEAVADLEQRSSLVEKRTTEAANGQEKLQAARQRAQQEIQSLLSEHTIAVDAKEFLQRIWSDKLTFILLRQPDADNSDDWRDAIQIAGAVIRYASPIDSNGEREQREQSLEEHQKSLREASATLQQPDKEKLLTRLFSSQKKLVDEYSPAAEVPVEVAEPEPVRAEQKSATASLSPEQETMIHELKSVPFGTWFEFTGEGEAAQRAKLSWRSTVTEKFMFVDQMGVKAAIISMTELADNMIAGKVRVIHDQKKPFVDRALNAIHRMLDHGTRQTAQA